MSKTIIFSPHNCFPPSRAAHSFDTVTLIPGSKEYSDEEVEALLEHPDYPRYKAWNAIQLLEPKDVATPIDELPQGLSRYSVDDAETIVLSCSDSTVLKEWLKAEKRTTLRQIINRRIAAIERGEE